VVLALAAVIAIAAGGTALASGLSFHTDHYQLGASSGYGVVVGDFNGDGKLDVVSADDGATVEYLKGKGDGTLADPVPVNDGATGSWGLAAGRFDKGKTLDLAVANDADDEILLLRGRGDGTFRSPQTFPVGPNPLSPAAADFNRDGHLDIAVANDGDTSVSVLLGKAHGGFKHAHDYPVCGAPYSISTGRMNGDRRPDIVTTGDSPADCVSVLLAKPDGTFKPHIDRNGLPPGPEDSITGDFNRDGKTDVAVADEATTQISVLMGKGNGHLDAPDNLEAGDSPWHIATGDFNDDGKLDLVAGNESSDFVSVFKGKGDGTFAAQTQVTVGDAPSPVATGNLDRRHGDDIVTNLDSNEIVVLRSRG
jgi:hypothetical protein